MFRRILCLCIVMALGLTIPALAEPYDGVVRLHVIADSDDPAAQALKLEIRDAILEVSREILASCRSAQDAWWMVNDHLSDFLNAAAGRMAELGESFPVSVQAGVFAFPDRTYGSLTLPAGEYRALRVIIGSGQGQNWWCVLFPNLCLPQEGEYPSILAGWLKEMFGGKS